jgi:hypothetical protein
MGSSAIRMFEHAGAVSCFRKVIANGYIYWPGFFVPRKIDKVGFVEGENK